MTTHSATGVSVAARDEGSEVDAVSSEMAIPYLSKTPRARTIVARLAPEVALVTVAAAHALGLGGMLEV